MRTPHPVSGRGAGGTVRAATLPEDIDDAWVCGERRAVQEIRRHLVERGVSRDRITFSGYWRLGEARG